MQPFTRRLVEIVVASALLVVTGAAASGQNLPSSRAFPGSFWVSSGTVGPAEPDTVLTQVGIEQGFTVWERNAWFLVPFASLRVSADSQGYVWNNKHPSMLGVKLVRRVPGGVVQGGGGVMFERVDDSNDGQHPTAFVNYWSGWTGDRRAHLGGGPAGFPGHVDASTGMLSGADPENWLTVISAQQGIAINRAQIASIVPYGGGMFAFDSKRRPWENRATYDLGVKLVRPVAGGVVEGGIAHRRQHQLLLDRVDSGPVAIVNLWIGWNPRTISSR
jgi:hypothetical protein